MSKSVTSHIEPLGSNQDHIIVGTTATFDNIIVFDGHGKGKCIESIKLFDWAKIISNVSAKKILSAINCELLLKCKSLSGDGSTISIVKIYKDKVHVLWLGDSQVHLLIDDNYYKTTNHNTYNIKEIQRETNIVNLNNTFKVINKDTCKSVIGKYFILSNGDLLAFSRTLGHDFATLQRFDELEIPLNNDSTIKILAATDGLYDMLYEETPLIIYNNYKATDYTTLAKNRWMQTWNIYTDNYQNVTLCHFVMKMIYVRFMKINIKSFYIYQNKPMIQFKKITICKIFLQFYNYIKYMEYIWVLFS